MSIAFYLLTALLATAPVLATTNGVFTHHVVAFAAAVMLILAATGPQREITIAAQLLKRFSLAILLPLLWMVFQTVPLPSPSPSNPIWSTAAIALNKPSLAGHISIDPETTFRSLISYLTGLSLVVSTVIIARDRPRAEAILLVLSVVTTFMSVEVLISQLASFAGLIPRADAAGIFAATAALAVVTNTAAIAMAIERHLNQPDRGKFFSSPLLFKLFLGLAGIAISLAAMKTLSQFSLFAATSVGFLAMLFVSTIRGLGFRPWPSAILFAILLVLPGALVIPRFQHGSSAGLLGFITQPAADTMMVAQRALADAPLVGNGVGTFEMLSRIYRDFDAKPIPVPPSTAVSIAIEWGRLALVVLLGFTIHLFFFTLRGAVGRGRDSFFASGAAAAILVVFCEAFLDSSLLSPTIQIIIAVIIGLGLSQSTGRTSSLES